MKIIIASENREKLNGVKSIFKDADIVTLKAKSYIGDVAFNSNMFNGAYNRITKGVLQDHGYENEDYDMIIALQSGLCEKGDKCFVTDVCAILDKEGLRIGNGPMFEIPRQVYDKARKGYKINALIGELSKGDMIPSILHYISQGVLNRSYASMLAVSSALNSDYTDLKNLELDYSSQISFENPNTKALIDKCYEIDNDILRDRG